MDDNMPQPIHKSETIVCPWCRHGIDGIEYISDEPEDGESFVMVCPECGEVFEAQVYFHYLFSTTPKRLVVPQ